jgi:hypothetical protein
MHESLELAGALWPARCEKARNAPATAVRSRTPQQMFARAPIP